MIKRMKIVTNATHLVDPGLAIIVLTRDRDQIHGATTVISKIQRETSAIRFLWLVRILLVIIFPDCVIDGLTVCIFLSFSVNSIAKKTTQNPLCTFLEEPSDVYGGSSLKKLRINVTKKVKKMSKVQQRNMSATKWRQRDEAPAEGSDDRSHLLPPSSSSSSSSMNGQHAFC